MNRSALGAALAAGGTFAYTQRYSLGLADVPAGRVEDKSADDASRFMEVAGVRVHYKDEENKDTNAPTLVMLHGTFSSLHTWDGWVTELADRYRLVRLDLPGFGLTGPPLNDYYYGPQQMVRFLDEFADRLGLESFYMAGNSLGGYLACGYAATRAAHIERLVLIDSTGYPLDRPWILKLVAHPVLGATFPYSSPRFLVRMNVREVYADETKITEELVERYHELLLREGNRRALREGVDELFAFDDHELVQKVAAPTLVLWGEEDRWVPLESHVLSFMRDLPDAELVVYPGAGHIPMEEIPRTTAADADEFLQGRVPAASGQYPVKEVGK